MRPAGRATTPFALAVSFGLSIGLLVAPAVLANFGGTLCDNTIYSQCVAPHGNPHYLYLYPSLTSRQATQMRSTIADYNALVNSSIQLSENVREDAYVTVSYGNFGSNGAWAYTTCGVGAQYGTNGAGDWCIQQLIRFNSVYLSHL